MDGQDGPQHAGGIAGGTGEQFPPAVAPAREVLKRLDRFPRIDRQSLGIDVDEDGNAALVQDGVGRRDE